MLSAIAAAGWLLAQSGAAPPPAQAPAAATPPAAAKPEKPRKPKLICEDEPQTDSFIPKRVCRTPEQIEAERQAGRAQADAVQDRLQYCKGAAC